MTARVSELRTLLYNAHAGQGLRRGRRSGLTRLIRTHRPDVVIVVEVRDMRDLVRAARGYRRVPGALPGREGVVVLLRRRTISRPTAASWRLITPDRDTMHPERRLVRAEAVHRPSGRPLVVLGVHLWAMGEGWGSPQDVVDKHVAQARDFAGAAFSTAREAVVLAGGDWNEDLDDRDAGGSRSAVAVMRAAGLTFAHRVDGDRESTSLHGRSLLDDVAYRSRDWCELVTRRTLTVSDPGVDHRAVLTVHRIRPQETRR